MGRNNGCAADAGWELIGSTRLVDCQLPATRRIHWTGWLPAPLSRPGGAGAAVLVGRHRLTDPPAGPAGGIDPPVRRRARLRCQPVWRHAGQSGPSGGRRRPADRPRAPPGGAADHHHGHRLPVDRPSWRLTGRPLAAGWLGRPRLSMKRGRASRGDGRAGWWVVARGGAHLFIASWVEEQVGWERPAGPSQIGVVRRAEPLRGALPA